MVTALVLTLTAIGLCLVAYVELLAMRLVYQWLCRQLRLDGKSFPTRSRK